MRAVSSWAEDPMSFECSKIYNSTEITEKGWIYKSIKVYHDVTLIYSTEATIGQ
jgi:hypothetical protein